MKKIVFVSGTRADYGKIKDLILKSQKIMRCHVHFGRTYDHDFKQFR